MLVSLLSFFSYFGLSLVVTGLFVLIYMWITPHKEVELIKSNNTAAAIAFAGALVGFALPVASVVIHAVSLLDFVVWGLIAGAVQVVCFLIFRLVYPRISERIEQGETASAVKLATVSLVVGMLNAASMTY